MVNQNKHEKSIFEIGFIKKIDPLSNFLIFSDPRGGSTWLAEILNQILKLPIIWEPLDTKYNKNFRNLSFGHREYIPKDEKSTQIKFEFEKLFKGKILNFYNAPFYDVYDLFFAKNFLIKLCRGNTLLPWILTNFELEHKPIHLVRHPLAVISSQIKHGAWPDTNQYTIPTKRNKSLYIPHQKYLNTLKSQEEILAATWCITNSYLLNHADRHSKWITVFYEDLFLNPQKNLQHIFNQWNIELDTSLIQVRKPSRMTKNNSPVDKKEQLSLWNRSLSKSQINKILKVMEYFHIPHYSEKILPDI